jgi:hypothetical protein
MTYSIRYRRLVFPFLWKKLKNIVGHKYDESQDKIVLFFADGSLREIGKWKECEVVLGVDWVLWTKKQMESETGTDIKLRVEE